MFFIYIMEYSVDFLVILDYNGLCWVVLVAIEYPVAMTVWKYFSNFLGFIGFL
jgi:hypothetical protein